MNLFHKNLHLLIHVKRSRCQNCKEVFSEPLSSVQSGSHQTYRLQEHIFEQCRDTTISYVSRQLAMSYKTIERIYYKMAKNELQDEQTSSVVGIDEFAVRKVHRYETVVTGIITGNVHEMGADRDYQSALLSISS
ncbi:hypothetical protein GCM10008986_09900 [Salinibacillus aidingensis]|uniref:Transposase IS204/IS1001/IS1096/IS1165 helix-turn-helix domain-containing protein n=2 Tax=Salinibacillus aidingensis TaxID=237684 RepID=A0ABP3KW81_9BACI